METAPPGDGEHLQRNRPYLRATASPGHVHDFHALAGRQLVVPRARVLCWAGAACTEVYVVSSGSLASHIASRSGHTQIVMFHLPGEIVGTAFPGARALRNCTSVAMETTIVSAISQDVWRDSIQSCPGCRDQFLQELGAQARHLETHLQILGRPLAIQRLALFLLNTAERLRVLRQEPNLLKLTLSRANLANYLGLAAETVCRLLGTLRAAGIIALEQRTIRLLDTERLASIEAGITPSTIKSRPAVGRSHAWQPTAPPGSTAAAPVPAS